MRIITKEIYETMQQISFHLLLKVSKKAETFDEGFYRELYDKKLAKRIEYDKEYPEEYEGAEFDEKETIRSFNEINRMNIKMLQDVLPKKILERVADIRVLAFNVASASVKRSISEFCKENDRIVKSALKELKKAEEREFGTNKEDRPGFFREYLHDCEVLSCRMRGRDLVLEVDNSGGFTKATGVIFKNAEIIEREERLAGADWLYSEVYKCERGLEIHALLWGSTGLKYLTLRCEDTVFTYDDDNGQEKAEI